MTTSDIPAFNVLRKKPRRCAHHVYSIRSPRSWAISSAILFSNPSPRSFENGRLFGSAQTRSTPAGRAICGATATGAGLLFTHAPAASNKRISPAKAQRRKGRPSVLPEVCLCVFAPLRENALRKREHIQHASSRRIVRQIAHRTHEPKCRRSVARL